MLAGAATDVKDPSPDPPRASECEERGLRAPDVPGWCACVSGLESTDGLWLRGRVGGVHDGSDATRRRPARSTMRFSAPPPFLPPSLPDLQASPLLDQCATSQRAPPSARRTCFPFFGSCSWVVLAFSALFVLWAVVLPWCAAPRLLPPAISVGVWGLLSGVRSVPFPPLLLILRRRLVVGRAVLAPVVPPVLSLGGSLLVLARRATAPGGCGSACGLWSLSASALSWRRPGPPFAPRPPPPPLCCGSSDLSATSDGGRGPPSSGDPAARVPSRARPGPARCAVRWRSAAHDVAAEEVGEEGRVDEAGLSPHVGQVGDPDPVRRHRRDSRSRIRGLSASSSRIVVRAVLPRTTPSRPSSPSPRHPLPTGSMPSRCSCRQTFSMPSRRLSACPLDLPFARVAPLSSDGGRATAA